jgi:hypothetical protein
VDRADLVAGYWVAALVAGSGVIVWGYRADRKGVPFPWDRYWHWWRICVVYGLLAAPTVIPFAWLVYGSKPPRWVFYFTEAFCPVFVFAMSTLHWRLWFPMFGTGLAFRTYARHTLRTAGYSAGLALVGGVIIFFLDRTISG